jgi:hypothetical protein
MAGLSEAETSQDVSEAEGSVIPDTPQEPSEPLAKFVIPGINVAVFPSKIGYVLRKCFQFSRSSRMLKVNTDFDTEIISATGTIEI